MLEDSLCRVCRQLAGIDSASTKLFEDENKELLVNLKMITGLWLERSTYLPEIICDCCLRALELAVQFRDQCIKSQRLLLRQLTATQLNDLSKEFRTNVEEAITNEETVDWDSKEQSTDDDENCVMIKLTSKYENVEADQAKPSESAEIEICEFDDGNSDDILDDEYIPTETEQPKVEKQKEKRSSPPVTGFFICEQCGNHIRGRVAFEMHCRRHRGDKQYQCEICHARFCTTSELKRHMRKHTGERPFACQYCGRRFTDYSTRVKHERTHTNERPYACQTCGKAFTTGYILKNHMLIHSGQRAFKCELCDKSFTRNTHLATHFRSSVHKRMASMRQQEVTLDDSCEEF